MSSLRTPGRPRAELPRVLVVDDDPSLLQVLERMLGSDFAVTTACDGEDGLQKLLSEGPFSVALVDLRMPRINGLQLVARAARQWPNCAYVMLTGNLGDKATRSLLSQELVFGALQKPCRAEEVIPTLLAAHQWAANRQLTKKQQVFPAD